MGFKPLAIETLAIAFDPSGLKWAQPRPLSIDKYFCLVRSASWASELVIRIPQRVIAEPPEGSAITDPPEASAIPDPPEASAIPDPPEASAIPEPPEASAIKEPAEASAIGRRSS
jgi:hypothetical protein